MDSLSGNCLILGYHEIAPLQPGMRKSLVVSPRTFARHLRYLRLIGRNGVTIEEIGRALAGQGTLPRRPVAITFDDGYDGVLCYAAPLLRQFGFPATVFVPSRLIGQRQGESETPPVNKLDTAGLKALMRLGVTVGSHTRTHADVAGLPHERLDDEIRGSRQDLEDVLGCAVTTFSFPFGSHDDAAVAAVAKAGYQVACTTRFGRVGKNARLHALPRVLIGDDLPIATFARRVFRSRRKLK